MLVAPRCNPSLRPHRFRCPRPKRIPLGRLPHARRYFARIPAASPPAPPRSLRNRWPLRCRDQRQRRQCRSRRQYRKRPVALFPIEEPCDSWSSSALCPLREPSLLPTNVTHLHRKDTREFPAKLSPPTELPIGPPAS